jgi:hypothetical protein
MKDELDRPIEAQSALFIPRSEQQFLTPDALTARYAQAPKIFPAAVRAGSYLAQGLFDRRYLGVLLAQPSQGKSGATTWAIQGFLSATDHSNDLLYGRQQVFWITMIGDNDIREQTKQVSIDPAGLQPFVDVLHLSNLPNAAKQTQQWAENILDITNYNTDDPTRPKVAGRRSFPVLLILDECHQGLGKNGVLDRLCHRIGIDLNTAPETWKNQYVSVIGVSATPFAQDLKTRRGVQPTVYSQSQVYSYVKLAMTDEYLSIAKLLANGRLRDNAAVNYEASNYAAFRREIRTVIRAYLDTYNRTTYTTDGQLCPAALDTCVWRVDSRMKAREFARIAEEEIRAAANDGDAVPLARTLSSRSRLVLFHHQKHRASTHETLQERPIAEFAPALASANPTHALQVFFIIKAAQAGKVLTAPSLIAWYDTTGTHTDTIVQSVGRGCGYGKEHETYLIHCNLAEVKAYLSWYDSVGLDVPSEVRGAWASVSKTRVIRETTLHVDRTLAEIDRLRASRGYALASSTRRSVRHLTQYGQRMLQGFSQHSADEHRKGRDRLEGYFKELLGDSDGRVLRSTTGKDSNVFVLPERWDGQFHPLVEAAYPDLVAQYRPQIVALYQTYGAGYYWQEPITFHDPRHLSRNGILSTSTSVSV